MLTTQPAVAGAAESPAALYDRLQTYAVVVAEEVMPRPPCRQDREDRDQAARLACWQACLTFDPARGTKPTTHVRWAVRNAITNLRRSQGRRPRPREAEYLERLRRAQMDGTTDAAAEHRHRHDSEPDLRRLDAALRQLPGDDFAILHTYYLGRLAGSFGQS
jgi:RNA polymerase sigma factor (sigma-70 family)